jgi:hypothetical protein
MKADFLFDEGFDDFTGDDYDTDAAPDRCDVCSIGDCDDCPYVDDAGDGFGDAFERELMRRR